MKEINCNKQAEHYFLASKDKWTDADFPDLRPPDSFFQMKFKLPDKIQIGGVLHPYPMRGVPVSASFSAQTVLSGQSIDNLTAPFDGWYVRGDFALDTLRYQAYYFCNDAGVIHNQ